MKAHASIGLLAAAVWLAAPAAAQTVGGDRIVAVVNDDIITFSDVEFRLNGVLESNPAPPADMPPERLRGMVLERLIEQKLILQEGKRTEVKVTDADVLDKLAEMKERIGSEESFKEWMDAERLSMATLKAALRDQLLAQRTVDAKVRSLISISPQEVAQEAAAAATGAGQPEGSSPSDQILTSHILIRTGGDRTEEQARQIAAEVQRRLAAGDAFADLAKEFSEDPQAEQGGSLGWVQPGQLLPELDAALFALKAGETSDPIQTRLGLHLLRAEESRTAAQLTQTEANEAAYRRIYQRKFQAALSKWVQELKDKAYIERHTGS